MDIYEAITTGDLADIKEAINKNYSDLNKSIDRSENKPLHIAVQQGSFNKVMCLIACEEVKVNLTNVFGQNALHILALGDFDTETSRIGHLLVASDVNLFHSDADGKEAIEVFLNSKNEEMRKLGQKLIAEKMKQVSYSSTSLQSHKKREKRSEQRKSKKKRIR